MKVISLNGKTQAEEKEEEEDIKRRNDAKSVEEDSDNHTDNVTLKLSLVSGARRYFKKNRWERQTN